MKRVWLLLIAAAGIFIMPGCYDQLNLEQASFTLMLGVDLNEENQLTMFHSSPLFSKESKEPSETVEVKATSFSEARDKVDAILTGYTSGGKTQTILVGKRVIEEYPDWFQLLDIIYRYPKLGATTRIVMVDGPVRQIFEFKPKDKPSLPLYLQALVKTTGKRNLSVDTNLQEFRRQMIDKGITPSVTQLHKDNQQIQVTGISLLNKSGQFAASLSLKTAPLLHMLQNKAEEELMLSIPYPQEVGASSTRQKTGSLSVLLVKLSRHITTRYADGQFEFDVKIKILVDVIGQNFGYDVKEHKADVEQQIAQQIQLQMTDMIQLFQKNKVDPIGFGLYARAYQYQAWKGVQDHWVEAFSQAQVKILPIQVKLQSAGVAEL